jgi:hypothetical protein
MFKPACRQAGFHVQDSKFRLRIPPFKGARGMFPQIKFQSSSLPACSQASIRSSPHPLIAPSSHRPIAPSSHPLIVPSPHRLILSSSHPLAVGDLLDAGDLQPLAFLDGLHEIRRLQQRVVRARVEPGEAASQALDPQLPRLQIGLRLTSVISNSPRARASGRAATSTTVPS